MSPMREYYATCIGVAVYALLLIFFGVMAARS